MEITILSIWIEWIRINSPYYCSLMFVFFTPAYVLWEIVWKRKWPHIVFYFMAFSIVGGSYTYFEAPNYINALYEILTNRFSFHKMSTLFFSSLSWVGWAAFFFQLEVLFSDKWRIKEQIRPLQEYILWFFAYMVYLNCVVWIIHSIFNR